MELVYIIWYCMVFPCIIFVGIISNGNNDSHLDLNPKIKSLYLILTPYVVEHLNATIPFSA